MDVERHYEAIRVADVNPAQAGDADSIPHAQRFARFLERENGMTTAWCLALLQHDGALDNNELNVIAAGTRAEANEKAKATVDKWLEYGRLAEAEAASRAEAGPNLNQLGTPLPPSGVHSQLQTPQGAEALGGSAGEEERKDNGSLRAFKDELQTGEADGDASDEEDNAAGRETRGRRGGCQKAVPEGRRESPRGDPSC